MKKTIKLSVFYFCVMLLFSSCKKDDDIVMQPPNTNENELITTVKLVLKEAGNSSNEQLFVSRDLDGDGPELLTIDTIRLVNGLAYTAQLLFLDESKNPVDTVSNEVKAEGNQHLLIYTPSGGANLSITRTDMDVNGVVLGLQSTFTPNESTSDKNGKLKIVLKHQGGDKTKDPNVAVNESIGSTDIEIYFPLIIQ